MKIIYSCLLFIFFLTNSECFISSKNNRLVDENGLERIFHGVNVVYKGYPWYPDINTFDPERSFNIDDVTFLKEWGFNVIRLGVMWSGVEPIENKYDSKYLDILEYIVNLCAKNDIYVMLDFHQDVLSENFCGEGIPSWAVYTQNRTHKFPYPIDKNYNFNNNIPAKNDCTKHDWITYQFTQEASQAYQDLYSNYNGLKDKFINYWKQVAIRFKDCSNCIGYELINEPWAGDIFKHPSLIVPKIADKENLEQFYDDIVDGIREIDTEHAILFESVTWDIYGVGFDYAPINQPNKSILSYHAYFPPNVFIETSFKVRQKDLHKLNVGGFLTEFSYGSGNTGDETDLKNALKIVDMADKYIQSWAVWEYKSFFPITGYNKGFFNSDGSLTNTYYTLSRPYPMSIEGDILKMSFNNDTKVFNLSYKPNYSINQKSKIYINEALHYPKGYTITISPQYSITYDNLDKNYLMLHLNRHMCATAINLLIKPK